jgi:hypothetical protein
MVVAGILCPLPYGKQNSMSQCFGDNLSKSTNMAGMDIIAVERKSELKDFIDLPWRIYETYPKWVPPLKKEVRRMLDLARHPFWESSERILFLARRGSETIGRIAGIIDRNYNQFHGEKMGIWGFFECDYNQEAAAALFAAVETWVRQKGMTFLRGPLNPSTNYEVGLLIEGFEHPPVVMMTYNPPYYAKLVESCGFAKEKDLLAFTIDNSYQIPDWMNSFAERIARKKTVRIEKFDPENKDRQFALVRQIYNDSWAKNWGFVPLSESEMRDIQKSIMKFIDKELAFFIYYDEQPAAVCVIAPDINPLLKRFNGHIGLSGLIKLLRYRREITGLRCLIFGIKEKYRELGVPLLALQHVYELSRKKTEYHRIELGWTLEDNESVNTSLQDAGARQYKKYRIFRKSL